MMNWEKKIIEQYGEEYILRQLAEESAELTQAALKMVRTMREETPVRWQDAQDHLLEEIADVEVMIDFLTLNVLNLESRLTIERIYAEKQKRMRERLSIE